MSESLSSQSKSNPAPFNPASIKANTSKRGIQFTETMRGYFSPDEKEDFDAGYAQGKKNNTTFDFSLTIQSLDLDEMINNEAHDASISGIVNAAALSPEPLIVTGGVFNCFVTDITNVNTRNMRYSMIFTSEAGEKYYFYGYKVIHDDLGFDAWSDTTTLYFTIWEGENDQGTIAGKGILKISPADFAKQMSTITALNVNTKSNKLKAIADFGYFFSKNLYEVYGSVLSQSNSYDPGAPPRIKRPLKMNPPEVFYFNTKDNTQLRLTRYKGGTKGPVLVSPGFGTSILAYTIDTVDTNFPEFLYENGYDIWLFDYRASPALKSGSTQFTLDDIAAFDYPAAVDKVIEVTGAENIQVMAHCIGSLTFLMSMCIGLKSIRSAVCSQLTAHPVGPFLSELKSGLYLATLIKTIGIKLLTTDYDPNSWKDRLFDQLLKLYPTKQPVDGPTDRRILFMYGDVYKIAQLNEATHKAMHEMFGVANLSTFQHIARLVRTDHIVDAKGNEVYISGKYQEEDHEPSSPLIPNVKRLAIPISFIHGKDNNLFLPEGSKKTLDWLSENNDPSLYSRHLIDNYAHMDCFIGKNAVKDVYPIVLNELDRFNN